MRNRIALAALLLVAAGLRLFGLDWDAGHGFHPDERNLVEAALRLGASGEPGFYAYNGLSLHAVRAVTEAAAAITGEPDSRAFATQVARWISALASLAAVAVGWRFGTALGGPALGLLFGALLATSAGLIQAAHFGTTESLLVLWLLATALAAARLSGGLAAPALRWRDALACGLFAGLALGTKTTGAAFLLMPAVAVLLALRERRVLRSFAAGATVVAIAALVFAVVSPHSWLHFDAFLAAMRGERAIAMGALPVFYTLQFRGAPPLRYEISNLHWLAGPLIPVLGIGGLLGLVASAWRDARWRPALPLVAFGIAYGIYVASWQAKFARYQIPLVPALLFGAAWALVAIYERRPRLAKVMGAAVLATSFVWAIAVATIYATPDPRLVASKWLIANAPPGSIVLNERRDIPLPVSRDATLNLEVRLLDGFSPDSDAKLATAAQELAAAEYVVLASDRVHAVVRANADLFPDTSALYRALFAGQLGYEPAARFESLPRIGPVRLRDDAVEETIRVFDHPSVLVFRNTGRRSAADLIEVIRAQPGAAANPVE